MGTKVLLVLPALQMLISEQNILVMPRMGENHPHPSTDPSKNLSKFHLLSAAVRGHNTVQQTYHHAGPRLSPTSQHQGCGSSYSSGGSALGLTFFYPAAHRCATALQRVCIAWPNSREIRRKQQPGDQMSSKVKHRPVR